MAKHRRKPKQPGQTPARGTRILLALAALIALIGLGETTYLTAMHLAGATLTCLAGAGCSTVLSSSYAQIRGIPLAGFGAVAYFSAFSFAVLAVFNYSAARRALAIVVALMFLFTLWLLYLQAFVLHAYCDYCLLSAALTFALAAVVILIPPQGRAVGPAK